jgi:hypothetical protein
MLGDKVILALPELLDDSLSEAVIGHLTKVLTRTDNS